MATLSISSQTTLLNPANFLVFALYDSSAPTVLLEKQNPVKPYGNPLQIMFSYNCLRGHVYIFKLWESADDTATGVVRNSTDVTVNGNQVRVKLTEYLTEGITSGLTAGNTVYVNTDWAGWEYELERVGLGTMYPQGKDGIIVPDYSQDVLGGFTLLAALDVIQPGEKFVAKFTPQVIDAAPDGTPSPLFGSGRIITVDETLTNADKNTGLLLQSASSGLVITLPALSAMADFDFLYLMSNGGDHINATIQTSGTDKIKLYNQRSRVYLGQAETLVLYKAFGFWNVQNDVQGILNIGELVYKPSYYDLNTTLLNGTTLNRVDYPRLWEYITSLESGAIVTQTAWNTGTVIDGTTYYLNKCKFHSGDGSTTFGVPLMYDRFLRAIEGSARNPGSLQIDSFKSHSHEEQTYPAIANGGIKPVGFSNTGATLVGSGVQTGLTGSTETRPINAGEYLSIRI